MKVVVVGAGIAGIACARELIAGGHSVRVLDRGRVPGGRLASRTLEGRPVDLGASYFTVSDARFRAVVDDWVARGVARPWTQTFRAATPAGLGERKSGPWRYGAAAGLRSVVEDLARGPVIEPGGLKIEHSREVRQVGPGPVVDGENCDAVVLAMPDPQALRLLDPADPAAELVAGRAWEPALAVAAGFPERTWDVDGVFVNDSPVLSWVADDGRRRGDGAAVLVAHSTGPFAAARLVEPAAAVAPMTAALRELLGLPAPLWTYLQRWTYAKPVGTRDAPYGLVGGIGLCGDGWGASKVEAAWLSGTQLGRALAVS